MSSVISVASQWKSLRGSIKQIMGDKDKYEPDYPEYVKEMSATKAYHDFQEYAFDGLLRERGEGTPIETGRLIEGMSQRVLMRTFAVQVLVTSEARDDEEQDKVLDITRRIRRAAVQTKDIDCAQFLNRFTSTDYVFADGQPLASNAHKHPSGATFSNILGTGAAPSLTALQTVRANLMKMEGYDGIREGYMIEKIICPVDQINAWETILGSSQVPDSNNNAINNMKKFNIKLVPVRQWTSTSTSWGVITDADGGLVYMTRLKDTFRDWVDENTDTYHYSVKYRSGRTNTNSRGHFWSVI